MFFGPHAQRAAQFILLSPRRGRCCRYRTLTLRVECPQQTARRKMPWQRHEEQDSDGSVHSPPRHRNTSMSSASLRDPRSVAVSSRCRYRTTQHNRKYDLAATSQNPRTKHKRTRTRMCDSFSREGGVDPHASQETNSSKAEHQKGTIDGLWGDRGARTLSKKYLSGQERKRCPTGERRGQ